MMRSDPAEADTLAPDLLQPWASALRAGHRPCYLQLVDFIEQAVVEGTFNPGDRLPAQRSLAGRLGIDLTTVTRGFNEARRRGLIDSRGPLGTFVAAPRAALELRVDLSMNVPPPPEGLNMHALLREGISRVLLGSDADLLMTYRLGGVPDDCAAGAKWLAPALGPVSPTRIAVCSGAQAALAAIILSFSEPGAVVLSEPLVYPGLPHAVTSLGRRLETVATDADGIRPDALEAACRMHGARLLYLNPTLQNPIASTTPATRRDELLRVAARYGLRIVEDDPYWRFASDAPPPFARLAPSQVCYVSTLSKALAPGLRTAFVALPDADAKASFLHTLRSFSLIVEPLTNALAMQWIEEGLAADIFDGVRGEAQERQRIAAQILGRPEGEGIHLWYPLPRPSRAVDFAAAASALGLAVAPSAAFEAGDRDGPDAANAIRISLGASCERPRFESALRTLSGLLSGQDRTGRRKARFESNCRMNSACRRRRPSRRTRFSMYGHVGRYT
ncbi:PLP-dependent aminotransferase family protein [Burkholderia sp. JPY481]